MWLNEINEYLLGLIVFGTQLGFILTRTMNVIYTSEHNTIGAMITGAVVHLFWLLGIAIGVKSVMYMDWFVILCSLTGGLLGTKVGIYLKNKLRRNEFKKKN